MGNVTLFIRKIPKKTTVEEITKFVKGGAPWRARIWLKITHVSILTTVDKASSETECHGLVTIEPESIAELVIKHLHAKHLNGQRVVVRRYYVRNAKNDRNSNAEYHGERRIREAVTFNAEKVKAFTRKLI